MDNPFFVAPLVAVLSALSPAGTRADAPPARAERLPYAPQYPLWSDGATKRRWIELPVGTTIDAARPDAWQFPTGTRFFKEFAVEGRRVETRVMERLPDGTWGYRTYVWNADGTDAMLAPERGIPDLPVRGAVDGRYTIPSVADCRTCHEGAPVPVLGFSALQLSPDRDPLAPHADHDNPTDLRVLVERGLLSNLPRRLLDSPPKIAGASPLERAALGYLHGNCAHCHSAPGESEHSVPVGLTLAQTTDGAPRIRPGIADLSVLLRRMRSREAVLQMPPLGSAEPDAAALALLARWVAAMTPLPAPTPPQE
jgi:hypothetical protein